jgi:hypothetical protein
MPPLAVGEAAAVADWTGRSGRRRTLGLLLSSVVAVAGCGSEEPPLSEAVMERLRAEGVAPELVYTIEVPGYALAEQSVGVVGDEGFGAWYMSPDGAAVVLTVDWGTYDDGQCQSTPLPRAEPADAPVTCERVEQGWYRSGGGRQEFVAVRDDHVVRVDGPLDELSRTTLRDAVVDARHVSIGATDTTAPSSPSAPASDDPPRGDLPSSGDGAPNNEVGPGG